MTNDEIIEYCRASIEKLDYIVFEPEVFETLDDEQAKYIISMFSSDTLMRLPDSEIKFYDWLKEVEPAIWQDLWKDEVRPPYLVGTYFLRMLIRKDGRGFPICDLLENDNYYFSMAHMPDDEAKLIIETAKVRFQNKDGLTAAHLLALEISMDPIDIWHFCYKHNVDLKVAKKAVAELVEDRALVHLTEAEHLAVFIDF